MATSCSILAISCYRCAEPLAQTLEKLSRRMARWVMILLPQAREAIPALHLIWPLADFVYSQEG